MNKPSSDQILHVLMVITRDIPEVPTNGRERTLLFIQESFSAGAQVEVFRLESVFEHRSLRRILAALSLGVYGLFTGHPVPLQTLLFYDPLYARDLQTRIARDRTNVVYFDGLRSGFYGVALKKNLRGIKLIADFDDLMSRRTRTRSEMKQSPSLGYLKKIAPAWISKSLSSGLTGRLIQSYEYRALRACEAQIMRTCDHVVLVSSVEAAELRRIEPLAQIMAIPPYVEQYRIFEDLLSIERFIFLGSDSFLQNRLTIEYLLGLWEHLRPDTSLHIFGTMSQAYPLTKGVIFEGFEQDIRNVYTRGSVLLAPTFVPGGVKTKVLDAICYGVVPVGNDMTFEGIDANFRGVSLSEQDIQSLVASPQQWLVNLNCAGRLFADSVMENHAATIIRGKWMCVLNGET
jgi:hypothetical protein